MWCGCAEGGGWQLLLVRFLITCADEARSTALWMRCQHVTGWGLLT
jgi:hypothetical protein